MERAVEKGDTQSGAESLPTFQGCIPESLCLQGHKENQTPTLSSFSHRLYCLNICNYYSIHKFKFLPNSTFYIARSLHSPFYATFS